MKQFINIVVFVAVAFVVEGATYERTWHSGAHKGIIIALAANKVRGCGSFEYRKALGDEEYLVRCDSGLLYLVWPNIKTVNGPFRDEPK